MVDAADEPRPVIDEAVIHRIAALAQLRIDPARVPELIDHFERMLEFVASLGDVDVSGIEPDFHAPLTIEELRPDQERAESTEIGDSAFLARVWENAPDSDGSHFVVPRVIDPGK